jgi:hypothetical protein
MNPAEERITQTTVDQARAAYAAADDAVTTCVWSLPLPVRALTFFQLDRVLPGFGNLRSLRRDRAAAKDYLNRVWMQDADQDMGRA